MPLSDTYSPALKGAIARAMDAVRPVIAREEGFASADEVFDACEPVLRPAGAFPYRAHTLRYWGFLTSSAPGAKVTDVAIIIFGVGVVVGEACGVFWLCASEAGEFAWLERDLDPEDLAKDNATAALTVAFEKLLQEGAPGRFTLYTVQ
ncbi:hypothetical protein GC169_01600 [bacterium]|nr:hypothetical protein [bacterium]